MSNNNPSMIYKVGGAGSLWLAAALLTLLAHGSGAAAAADVRLAGVDCAGNPEVVEIKNFGNEGQDLSGWQLESDGNDPFDLTPAGTIPAGGSIFIESGPGAQATFTWSSSQVFRDNDATDFVRLVDNDGVPKGQTACGQSQATATPTAAPTAAVTPTPTAGQVPNGGGPPGAPEGVLSPAVLIYAGGSVIGATALAGVTWLGVGLGLEQRRRRRQAPAVEMQAAERAADPEPLPEPAVNVAEAPAKRGQALKPEVAVAQPLLIALIVAIAAAILVALLVQSQDSTRPR